jgi:hypothetical protein
VVAPWATLNETERLPVATNSTAVSSVTPLAPGVKPIVMVPKVATAAGLGKAAVNVCCSPLFKVGVSKLRIGAGKGLRNPVPLKEKVCTPTVRVPENVAAVAALKMTVKEMDCPAGMAAEEDCAV